MQFSIKPNIKPTQELKTAVREAIAEDKAVTEQFESEAKLPVPATREATPESKSKLSRLVDGNIKLDDSQLAAVRGMLRQTHACLTGAAGTGKTTVTKFFTDAIIELGDLDEVDLGAYHAGGEEAAESMEERPAEKWAPSIVLCAFTGRASQMIKRNFPRDWHPNIMTIHRMLGFKPVWESVNEVNEDGGVSMRKKVRFVPTYTASNKMPWRVILIDEAGMLGTDLWAMVEAAMRHDCRVYMIGDINQLPPTHGRSAFGFAMSKWPSYELTHVHRQKGQHNAIVDNAWRVLRGEIPVSGGNFQMIPLRGNDVESSKMVRAIVPALRERVNFVPERDVVIVPHNGELGARGYPLGQLALNEQFALLFNATTPDHPRYLIDAGRDRKRFAVGDKVMATKNDHEIGVTNGMTGVITSIERNGAYSGNTRRFGDIEEVKRFMAEDGERDEDDGGAVSLEEMMAQVNRMADGKKDAKESADRGPSSHSITVRFGEEDSAFDVVFDSLGEVSSLMTAYAATCHKMQGGECPIVVIVIHDAMKPMLFREWLYTAITRASQLCILLYTTDALRAAIGKQNIKGSTLAEKVESFNRLQSNEGLLGPAVKIRLAESKQLEISDEQLDSILGHGDDLNFGDSGDLVRQPTPEAGPEAGPRDSDSRGESGTTTALGIVSAHNAAEPAQPVAVHGAATLPRVNAATDVGGSGPAERVADSQAEGPTVTRYVIIERVVTAAPIPPVDVDGGELTPVAPTSLPAPTKLVSQWGAYHAAVELGYVQLMAQRLLPAPPKPPAVFRFTIGGLPLAKKEN